MKKIAIIAGSVLAVLIALVLIVPALIDWNSYKGEITAKLEQALGRKVTIAGDLSMSLLPSPALSAQTVSLANIPGAEPPDMATIEALKVRIGLLPLLTGRIAVHSLVLEQPVVHLQKLPDGRANWQFETVKAEAAAPSGGQDGASGAPEDAASQTGVSLGAVAIENGTVIYHSDKGRETRLERIGLNLSGDSLDGPYSLSGDMLWQGTEVRLEGSSGLLTEDKTPAALTVRLPQADAELRFSGLIQREGPERSLRGKLTAGGDSVRDLIADLAGAQGLPAGLDQNFALNGTLTASGGQAALNDMTLRLGETEAGGGISVAYAGPPQADIVLAFNRLALDEWLKDARTQGEARGPVPPAADGKAPPPTVEAATAGKGFSLPQGIGVSLDVTADAVSLDQRMARRVKLNAALADGEITINQAHLELPGNSDLTLFGSVAARDGKPVLDGKVEAASDDLRALLDWAAVDVSSVPADRLRQFSATALLQGSPEEFHLANVDLRLDTQRLNGAATVRLGGRPAFGVTVLGDSLNLDAYLPKADQPQADRAAGKAPPQQAKDDAPQQAEGGGLDLLRRFDANFKARIGQVTAGGMTARDVAVDATLLAGELSLRDTGFADLAGASAKLNGKLKAAANKGWALDDMSYELRSRQPGKTLRAFGLAPPPETDQLGGLAMTGTLSGTLETVMLNTRSEVAGALLAVNGNVQQPLIAPRYDLSVEASHASLTQLIRIFAADYRPAGPLGAFALTTRLRGDAHAIDLSDLRTRLGPVNAAGDILVNLGAKPLVTANLTTNDLPVAMFLPAKRAAAAPVRHGDWIGGEGSIIPASYRKVAQDAPPVQAAPRQGVRSESIDSRPSWSRDPLDLSVLNSFDAKIKIASQAVIYEKYRLDGAKLDLAVADSSAVVDRLTGKLFGGDLVFTGKLGGGGGTPAASGKLTVTQANIREAMLGFGKIEISEGLLDAAATLSATGRTMDEMVGRLNGDAGINARNGAVSGFDLKEVSRRLSNIENIGNLLQLLQAGLSGGSTRFSTLTGTFKAQNGIVTTNDLLLQAEAGEGRGEAAFNLPRYVMDAVLRFRLTEHGNAPPLSIRLEGPIDNPKRIFDINDIQSWLVGKGMGRMLKSGKGAEGQILQGLFGKPQQPPQTPADQAPPPPSDQPPPKPEKVLRDTLKGLIR